ncbi:hypothetical protein LTR56_017405 [Elasticomyces elasticus]|nr:hypothetical protein LTR56_017405 [Elasticomyces elasticus]
MLDATARCEYSKVLNNSFLGTKLTLAPLIAHATGIHIDFIRGVRNIHDAPIAQRMSWASKRETSRLEDMAYSLLGIFDVNMPLLYGEGHKAFARLQEQIIRQSYDESILAWGLDSEDDMAGVLAKSPAAFEGSLSLRNLQLGETFGRGGRSIARYELTNKGLDIHPESIGNELRAWILREHGSVAECSIALRCIQELAPDESPQVYCLHLNLKSDGNGNWCRSGIRRLGPLGQLELAGGGRDSRQSFWFRIRPGHVMHVVVKASDAKRFEAEEHHDFRSRSKVAGRICMLVPISFFLMAPWVNIGISAVVVMLAHIGPSPMINMLIVAAFSFALWVPTVLTTISA